MLSDALTSQNPPSDQSFKASFIIYIYIKDIRNRDTFQQKKYRK